MHEKRGVIEEGITPPEPSQDAKEAAEKPLEEDLTKRLINKACPANYGIKGRRVSKSWPSPDSLLD